MKISTACALLLSSSNLVSADSYEVPDNLDDFLSYGNHQEIIHQPNAPTPLAPPALTYIPAIGLGTWLSKGEKVGSFTLPINTSHQ